MSGLTHGMNVEAVRAAMKAIEGFRGELETLTGNIDAKIKELPEIWKGTDSNQFVQLWDPEQKQNLMNCQTMLTGIVDSGNFQASQQEQTSAG